MLGKSLPSPLLSFEYSTRYTFSSLDLTTSAPNFPPLKQKSSHNLTLNIQTNVIQRRTCNVVCVSKKWELHSIAQKQPFVPLEDEDRKIWESCRLALSTFKFSVDENDTILGKAFGWVRSPYWGEERTKEVPKPELVNEVLNYLRNLGLSDDDLCKLIKKFPEVLGCNLNDELKINVSALEKEWGIKGKALRSLLLRNPQVLGYNVDCKGDCMAKCTRCWVRF